eukprot:130765_1
MSIKQKQKQKHRKKSDKKRSQPFTKPSVSVGRHTNDIINRDMGTNESSVPLPIFEDGTMVLDDISEVEVQQIRGKYTGQYTDPYKMRTNGHSNNNKLNEIQDTDPYNRRESFLADISHEPYWQDKEAGSHPFQTPKSTKDNRTPSFFKDPILQQNTDTNAQGFGPLVNAPNVTNTANNRQSDSSSRPSNTSDDTKVAQRTSDAIPEEDTIIQMPSVKSERDIYSIDDMPNHNGRITTFARNGEMNPTSLYKIGANQEDDSYEDEDSR